MDEKEIRKRLAGRAAEYMMFRDDEENAETTAEISSPSNVIVFPDFEKLKSEVEKMRTELSMLLLERDELQFVICKNIETEYKLRVHGLSAEGVAIHIRDNTLNTRQWQTKIALPTQSPMIIAKTAFQLFEKRYGWNNPIRSVTVQAINLVPQDTPRQIDMFMDAAKQDKLERMEKCVEEIRRRFGKDSIRNGVLCQNLRLPPEKAEITMPTGMVG